MIAIGNWIFPSDPLKPPKPHPNNKKTHPPPLCVHTHIYSNGNRETSIHIINCFVYGIIGYNSTIYWGRYECFLYLNSDTISISLSPIILTLFCLSGTAAWMEQTINICGLRISYAYIYSIYTTQNTFPLSHFEWEIYVYLYQIVCFLYHWVFCMWILLAVAGGGWGVAFSWWPSVWRSERFTEYLLLIQILQTISIFSYNI